MKPMVPARQPLARGVWRVPVLLALFSIIGLASALFGDYAWDVLSWLALGAPLAIILWKIAMPVR